MLVFTVHTCRAVKLKTSVFHADLGRLFVVSDELVRDDD
jgi:hypothetical protein